MQHPISRARASHVNNGNDAPHATAHWADWVVTDAHATLRNLRLGVKSFGSMIFWALDNLKAIPGAGVIHSNPVSRRQMRDHGGRYLGAVHHNPITYVWVLSRLATKAFATPFCPTGSDGNLRPSSGSKLSGRYRSRTTAAIHNFRWLGSVHKFHHSSPILRSFGTPIRPLGWAAKHFLNGGPARFATGAQTGLFSPLETLIQGHNRDGYPTAEMQVVGLAP